jgi:hypothetical protein
VDRSRPDPSIVWVAPTRLGLFQPNGHSQWHRNDQQFTTHEFAAVVQPSPQAELHQHGTVALADTLPTVDKSNADHDGYGDRDLDTPDQVRPTREPNQHRPAEWIAHLAVSPELVGRTDVDCAGPARIADPDASPSGSRVANHTGHVVDGHPGNVGASSSELHDYGSTGGDVE